ncbi:hypothetical protein RUND412_000795 [Rhizina undulata]
MKTSFFAFLSTLLFLVSSVVAAPTAAPTNEITARTYQDVDVILNNLYSGIITVDTTYNATSVSALSITNYCNAIVGQINIAIGQINLIPSGYTYTGDINIIVNLIVQILVEVNCTLQLLLSKQGLLGGLLTLVFLLVGGLIAVIAQLLVLVGGLVDGVLVLVAALLNDLFGGSFLLTTLGLVL